MLKPNYIKNILKISSIILVLIQLSCVQNKKRENIIVASAGKIESLDPAQANTLRTLQILSALRDTLYIINKDGNIYRRIADVFDCWFESGSMPYSQSHFPFENKDKFLNGFPADFVAEGLDQTRGWFYTLMVISTALFDKPPFKNLIVNGMVLASDGKKMSKVRVCCARVFFSRSTLFHCGADRFIHPFRHL